MNKAFLFLLIFLCAAGACLADTSESSPQAVPEAVTHSGWVLMVLPQYNFVDNEYTIPKVVISRAGYSIEVASTSTREIALGEDVIKVRPNLSVADIDSGRYIGVVFVGGYMSKKFFEDKALIEKTLEMNAKNVLIGAMDNTPYFLAKWGVVGDAKVTVNRSLAKAMKTMGVNYVDKDIVIDRNLITVDNLIYSDEFARDFVDELSKR